ncbi:MAG: hypothetical protein FJX74_08945 [Armatimonadetes bacterium]|nr:hypothetical protein [Armatimonadota bacterium]
MKTTGVLPAIALALCALSTESPAAGLAVMGSCQVMVGPQWLIQATRGRATLPYTGEPAAVLLSVTGMSSPLAGWRVEVRREGGAWPEGMKLWVRRSGDGVGAGRLSGAHGFTEITPSGTLLCLGQGDRTGIPLQFRITGLSLHAPVGAHMAGVSYGLITIGE